MTDDPPPSSGNTNFLSSTMGKVWSGLAVGVGGTLTLALTPLRDEVINWVWPEDIQMVGAPINVVEGEPAPLNLTLMNRGRGPLKPSGAVTVRSVDDSIRIVGNPVIGFSSLEGTVLLEQKPPLQIVARTFGTQRLAISIRTARDNEFKGELLVNAAQKPHTTSVRNITGEYDIALNSVQGTMALKNDQVKAKDMPSTRKSRYTGTAEFEDGRRYDVKVWRDGTVFHVDFFSGAQKAYAADGLYCTSGPEGAKWLTVNAKVVQYPAGASAPTRAEDTVREKCPGFPQDLASRPGDGWFFASVALD